MVSAGAGNKKAFGLDRTSNSYADLAHAEVIMLCGSNVSETFPTLTHWIWQARDNGAKLIVVDPRVTPIARTADLHLPIKPGTDSALYGTILRELIRNDWVDHEFINRYTSGFEAAAEAVHSYDPVWAESVTGIPARLIQIAAEWWGKAKTSFLLHARGIEHHSKGVENVSACINLVLPNRFLRLYDYDSRHLRGSGDWERLRFQNDSLGQPARSQRYDWDRELYRRVRGICSAFVAGLLLRQIGSPAWAYTSMALFAVMCTGLNFWVYVRPGKY
ncbi:MAG: molybdopterin-dependent oxidoreductase [Chthoniobacterales bacterium]